MGKDSRLKQERRHKRRVMRAGGDEAAALSAMMVEVYGRHREERRKMYDRFLRWLFESEVIVPPKQKPRWQRRAPYRSRLRG